MRNVRRRGAAVTQGITLVIFVIGATLAGLAAIHLIWLHPAVIGPFALMIGMTPLVLLFEYSLEIPGYLFPLGALSAGVSWLLLRRNPPRPVAVLAVLLSGGALTGYGVIVFILASAHYNVGMAGD